MDNIQHFLLIMAALSTAAQKLTEQLVKGRFVNQLGMQNTDPVLESRRQAWLHLVSAGFGVALCNAIGVNPVQALRGQDITYAALTMPSSQRLLDFVATGAMVSFGGSFFNEVLGVLREFKDAQSGLKRQFAVQNASTDPPGGVVPADPAFPGAAAQPIAAVPPVAPGNPAGDTTGDPVQGLGDFRDEDAEALDPDYFDQDLAAMGLSAPV